MMREEALSHASGLDIGPEQLNGIEHELGPDGLGVFVIDNAVSPERLMRLQEEVFDPTSVAWRDNHNVFVNKRGITVVENHLVFALKLRQGDPTWVNRLPEMRGMAEDIQTLVRGLGRFFINLDDWTADEMSLHRYDDPNVGLSYHKDNLRFKGIVSILELEGERDFAVKGPDKTERLIPMWPGRLILNRASGLYDVEPSPDGKEVNLCPDHGVYNLRTPTSTSFIVRANSRPDEELAGFEYDNWGVRV